MFPGRASQYHFLYSPESQRILRDPLEKRHGLKFLFSHCELRGIQLGLSWEDRPTVTKLEELFGTKNRVTGTQLGRIAMQLLNLNPVPVAWEETLDGLKQGLIDGAETWASAVAYANMSPVVSQSVDLGFFCGTEHTSMSVEVFNALEPHLQDAVMESAYLAQVHVQAANEAALVKTVGFSDPQLPGTLFVKTTSARHSWRPTRSGWPRRCARRSSIRSLGPSGASASTTGPAASTPMPRSIGSPARCRPT